ncbi:VWA domain-containing protein [uncultured Polaribacter sp.]|uniref:VWA domain-containing protein n=1 Tax=uncultured Polaribacter sp. TaxID=174711 RepID=UPI00261393F6|nr:VWA domain-containing protein [uncultured Polaribacter sp.]
MINPTIKRNENINTKPILSVLVDNSVSIPFFNDDKNIVTLLQQIKEDEGLNDKFEIDEYSFGKNLNILDSLSFKENETNISKAIGSVNQVYNNKIAPILLLTDGNQTIGNDYEFIKSNQKVYPIVFGDTAQYKDLRISQLNVNKYSYLKNKFPVEVLLNYEGKENVSSVFSIYYKGKTAFSKRISFTSDNNSKTITTNLTSTKEGLQYYTASIKKINGEKNTKNNTKNFSVEVIDEQTKILVLTSILHPDLGALKKAIEANKQRSVEVKHIDNYSNEIKYYQLVMLYNINNKFKPVLNEIISSKVNYFLISGVKTDWNFINKKQIGISKKAINQVENYSAFYENSFLTFLQKDIGFNQFPPLQDQFGEVKIAKEHQTLLYQNINGIQTKQPLLATFEENNQKSAVLFGQGIWKWRAASFLNGNSFQDFDEFIGNLVQYLASNKKRNRLDINANTLYPANSTINISAFYTDKNYQFDARANLEITITNNNSKKVAKFPFSLINNSYQTEIENLSSGDYSYIVSVLGQNIAKKGRFKITEYQIEEEFVNANSNKLLKLADKTGGKRYYKNQFEELKKELLAEKSFYTTQKSITKEQNLIDWKWILIIAISLLTLEWFIRKYYGKI